MVQPLPDLPKSLMGAISPDPRDRKALVEEGSSRQGGVPTVICGPSPGHLDEIDVLTEAAKRTWNYDPAYLTAALPLLRVDAEYLRLHTCFEARAGDRLIGFAAVEFDAEGARFWTSCGSRLPTRARASDAFSSSSASPSARREGAASCGSSQTRRQTVSTCARVPSA